MVPNAENDVLADLRKALRIVDGLRRTVVVHPDHEAAAQEAIDASPWGHFYTVTANRACPRDRILLMPTNSVLPPAVGGNDE